MRPKTPEQYVDLVDQVIFELEELRMSAEYDMDSLGDALEFLGELEGGVRALRQSMADGSYRFADEDLPFMPLVAQANELLLPFKDLFRVINETHRQGLDVGEH